MANFTIFKQGILCSKRVAEGCLGLWSTFKPLQIFAKNQNQISKVGKCSMIKNKEITIFNQ